MMYLLLLGVFILGLLSGIYFKGNGHKQLKTVEIKDSVQELVEENKEESLQKLVEEHNKAIVSEFEKMRMSASSIKRIDVIEEVEYDEAIFI